MSTLKLTDMYGRTLAEIDLGEPDERGYFNNDNVFLVIDGRDYGSLFIHPQEDGTPTIALGQYDQEQEWWIERNPITALPPIQQRDL